MKIAIAGGSGFIGEPLVRRLVTGGHDVAVLSRNPSKVHAGRGVGWDARTQGGWSDEVAKADVVINLAGENIGDGRWTADRKRRLVNSRLNATNALVEALKQNGRQPVFISASAIGYYGPRGDEILDESARRGSGFLAELVEKWEAAARHADLFTRLVIPRFGVVLARGGGALGKMLLPFRLGLGGPVGSGQQWMSWVDRDDVLRAIGWLMEKEDARGVYDITAPDPVRNRDFVRALGRALHRPAVMPAPAFALRLAFGEMAEEILLTGQRVVPKRLMGEGFAFESTDLEATLRHIIQ
ncbi:MAG TPA: TIGR01777 family oxidoreductase [Thermoanaerobaculia bacterium]|nr:TIGR01777 family oxidoreductase [Thermoanaerobaculia bacterium]